MAYEWMFGVLLASITSAANVRLLQCNPPDEPIGGGYGPKQDFYLPGDTIHYYCETDTFIGGNFLRKCEDTGAWSGDTPVCDAPAAFETYSQSSTVDDDRSEAELAVDGRRETCSSTEGGERDEWSGTFMEPGDLIRVMLFFPTGPVSFQVVLVKSNGDEVICGSQTLNIDRYDWTFQNCPEPNNTGASGIKIKSLTNEPLQICEIQAYVLTSPKCTDPRMIIENGHLNLDRHQAVLACDQRYLRSRDTRLDCIREGVWNRKTLYCSEPDWEDQELATNTRRTPNPDREREKIEV